jgi:hypothetical protein
VVFAQAHFLIGVAVHKDKSGTNAGEASAKPSLEQDRPLQPSMPDTPAGRVARAKLVEKTSYQLTDLFTVIHGQTQILRAKLPQVLHDDLLPIREAVMKGMEFNKLLLSAARACEREVGD